MVCKPIVKLYDDLSPNKSQMCGASVPSPVLNTTLGFCISVMAVDVVTWMLLGHTSLLGGVISEMVRKE